MRNRRLIPLGLGAVALLAVVALAARGGSLHSGGSGSGATVSFWNYAFTTLLIIEILAFVGGIWVIAVIRPGIGSRKPSSPGGTVRALIILISLAALFFYVQLAFFNRHGSRTTKRPGQPTLTVPSMPGVTTKKKDVGQQLTLQWEELIVVLALVTAAGAVYVVRRKQLGRSSRLRRRGTAPETVAAALDESLDDLRSDPDLRRAIVAAYARMERALAAVGLRRDPAEAPLEYLERVLLSLDAGADAVRSLTDLFEWARFSDHEPEPSMRDEAVDALIAVRDELRNAERQLA